jgi:hypothetical protein
MDARNQHVKEGLQQAYASKVPGGKLEVFCVSNTTYEKYSTKGNAAMVHASGVPELRRFCHHLTANAQLLEAKHFLRSTLSSLLNSVELWARNSCDESPIIDANTNEIIYETLQHARMEVCCILDFVVSPANRCRHPKLSTSQECNSTTSFKKSLYSYWACSDSVHTFMSEFD